MQTKEEFNKSNTDAFKNHPFPTADIVLHISSDSIDMCEGLAKSECNHAVAIFKKSEYAKNGAKGAPDFYATGISGTAIVGKYGLFYFSTKKATSHFEPLNNAINNQEYGGRY